MTEKSIYDLDLHEGVHIESVQHCTILRVPGGWVYTIVRLDCNQMNSVFVPFDNGFWTLPPNPDRDAF